jgi:hypothetical protein
MQDLEIAKKQLYEKQLKLVIVKDRQVLFQTDSHRISGFIHAIDNLGVKLSGASVADRVGGKALALLCVYAGIHEVYAEVLSKKAKAVFEANEVTVAWKQIVDNVLNSEKTDVCPFEKVAADITDPRVSYAVFKALLTKMKTCG